MIPPDLSASIENRVWLQEKKVQGWICEILRPFVEIDLLKFDPFARTSPDSDLAKIGSLEILRNLQIGSAEIEKYAGAVLQTFWETVWGSGSTAG